MVKEQTELRDKLTEQGTELAKLIRFKSEADTTIEKLEAQIARQGKEIKKQQSTIEDLESSLSKARGDNLNKTEDLHKQVG